MKEFRKRTTAGAAMLLVKVKAHQDAEANEEANLATCKQTR